MKMNRTLLKMCLVGLVALTGLNVSAAPISVTATTTMVADLVRQVGGDQVKVEALMGPGVDPHLYAPSTRDILKLNRSKVIFYSGLHLEGKMTDLFARMTKRGKPVYAVTGRLNKKALLKPEDYEGHHDPHVWGDASLWRQTVDVVAEGLSKADPANKSLYAKNAAKHKAELETLHTWAKKRVSEIPTKKRVLVTSHDAFAYLGKAYGLEVVGVQGVSTATEAGLADIAKTVDFIKSREIKAIFVESSVSPAVIQRISSDSGARIGGELFSDACGPNGDIHEAHGEKYDVGTVVGMLKHNINTAVDALKGT